MLFIFFNISLLLQEIHPHPEQWNWKSSRCKIRMTINSAVQSVFHQEEQIGQVWNWTMNVKKTCFWYDRKRHLVLGPKWGVHGHFVCREESNCALPSLGFHVLTNVVLLTMTKKWGYGMRRKVVYSILKHSLHNFKVRY